MWRIVLFVILSVRVHSSDVFHESSKITFYPDDLSEYFGYTVVLRPNGLIVGAPKARSRLLKTISPGQVFICTLSDLDIKKVPCTPLGVANNERDTTFRKLTYAGFLRNDMWFGSTIAVVPQNKLMVCGSRWANPYKDSHYLANGACYVQMKSYLSPLIPLKDSQYQAYLCDGSRKEYGDYMNHLNYYAYGQAGFSLTVTPTTVLVGAPGLLQWTGGVIEYQYSYSDYGSLNKLPVVNPYHVNDLGPDEYFGYSVESGVFGGSTLYIAGAPRSRSGYGLVLLFKTSVTTDTLDVKARIRGPQLGAYFGAALLCADVNGDGATDLLVGAPNYATRHALTYDQGAVFVYLTENQGSNYTLRQAGFVFGSGASGARFGSAMADLGDINNDGFNDIAIGSPWEDSGQGAVYIYKGSPKGLRAQFIQRITVANGRSFGISISTGYDIDSNNCSDIAVGAHSSRTAYIFRCIPTVHVEVSIRVPDAMNLEENVSNFTALFCVKAATSRRINNAAELRATILIDPEGNRARVSGDSQYNVTIRAGTENCEEQVVEVMPIADLSRPITMKFSVESLETHINSTTFPRHAARLSDQSVLHSSFDIQLMRGCGDDLICRPLLLMTLGPLHTPYVPGTDQRLGVRVSVTNTEEPAFGAKVQLTLPASLKREPAGCSLDGQNLTCALPAPLYKNSSVEWEIELEYTHETGEVTIEAILDEPFFNGDEKHKANITIPITPQANFFISGKALPNATVTISRDKLRGGENLTFLHYFEVTNEGPSDWSQLLGQVLLSDKLHLSAHIKGCSNNNTTKLDCAWDLQAKTSMPLQLSLRVNFAEQAELFTEVSEYNISTTLLLHHEGKTVNKTILTTLTLEPPQLIWPIVVGGVFGIVLLSFIVYLLHRCGFFSRNRVNEANDTLEEPLSPEGEGTSYSTDSADDLDLMDTKKSTEMLLDDSD